MEDHLLPPLLLVPVRFEALALSLPASQGQGLEEEFQERLGSFCASSLLSRLRCKAQFISHFVKRGVELKARPNHTHIVEGSSSLLCSI